MPIEVITGRAGAGKTAMLSDILLRILRRNEKFYKKTGILRTVNLNFPVNTKLKERYGKYLKFWTELEELVKMEECDIFIDELLYYFDAQLWKETTRNIKKFIAIHRHLGVEIYATSQDFAQVDISFRRLTDKLFYLVKILSSRDPSATKPPVKTIWGVSVVYTIPPTDYKEDQKENKTSFSSLFFLTRAKCEVYDTKQKFERTQLPAYEHIVRHCGEKGCEFVKTIHL